MQWKSTGPVTAPSDLADTNSLFAYDLNGTQGLLDSIVRNGIPNVNDYSSLMDVRRSVE